MMRRHVVVLAAATSVVLAMSGVAGARSPIETSAPPGDEDQASGGEYVVSFDAATRDAALAAIAEAGGAVVDVHEQIGLALVEATEGDFSAAVAEAEGVTGVAQNQSIGATREGVAQVKAIERLTVMDEGTASEIAAGTQAPGVEPAEADPLEGLQWDMAMIGATGDTAHQTATGRRVTVGIIDTGVDASHPDIAPHFSYRLSRNFTHDMPTIDGPCDVPTCIDPAWVDEGGHGTHVAGIVAAARNGIGITGVAPDATIVNVRAGQDSGYFFFYETVSALLYAADAGLDVVNMSFYTDPWLFNCPSLDDYISGDVTEEEIAEQAMIRTGIFAALEYAHEHGVTLVAAAGNSHTDLAAPTRFDNTSPDFPPVPPGMERERVVTNNCLDLPTEGPHVLTVGSVGPSTTKADYSSYGQGVVEVSAPGGWFRDGIGTPSYRAESNQVLSSYPYALAKVQGLIDQFGNDIPDDGITVYTACDREGRCGAWRYLQGTSMASPHVAGEAALVVQAHGFSDRRGWSLAPDIVAQIIMQTATDHACPPGGVEIYTDEGRTPDFNAVCQGSTAVNGLYGEGIINAAAAVSDTNQ